MIIIMLSVILMMSILLNIAQYCEIKEIQEENPLPTKLIGTQELEIEMFQEPEKNCNYKGWEIEYLPICKIYRAKYNNKYLSLTEKSFRLTKNRTNSCHEYQKSEIINLIDRYKEVIEGKGIEIIKLCK